MWENKNYKTLTPMEEHPDIRTIKGMKIAVICGSTVGSLGSLQFIKDKDIRLIVSSDKPVTDEELAKVVESEGFQEKLIPQAEPIAQLMEKHKIFSLEPMPHYDISGKLYRKEQLNQSQSWKKKHKKY
jgi:phosphopantothenoylcysteine synthetase/decarboxylase